MNPLSNIPLKFVASLLLAVFIFAPVSAQAKESAEVKAIIALETGEDLSSVVRDYGVSRVTKMYSPSGSLYSGMIPSGNISKLNLDPRVAYAEPDQEVSASLVTTNDPFFTTESNMEEKQWYLSKIRVTDAWDRTRGSANTIVAVIDTGIHASHLDLNDGRIIAGYNLVDDQPIPANSNSDDNGHGTAVAGVIGAIPNNQRGIAGINWNVQIMPVKALKADGTGDLSSISSAIIWAADHGAHIINLSLGGSGFPNNTTMANAVAYAFNKGILIVAAAGNDTAINGQNLDTNPVYPICADNGQNHILGVAATDFQDRKASFSNFGIACVDITAPGKKILTTAYLPSDPADNILIYASGTSLATPVVSGVAALMKAQNPSLTNVQMRDLILNTADGIDSINTTDCLGTSCAGFLGKGRINANSATSPQPIANESLVRETATGAVFLISGGVKRYVSPFVLSQKYSGAQILIESSNQLAAFPLGPAVAPKTGTLIKGQTDPTVYYIDNNVRRPLTYLVFVSRKFSFADVVTLPEPDVNQIQLADWYWPPDKTLVLVKGDPTVFVMDQQVARPTTYFVFTQRRLSFANVITVTPDEFSHVPRPKDSFWLPPLEGTLVKSVFNPTVYVIENGARRPITGSAFAARNYRFSNVRALPQAEIDVIMPGLPIL